MDVLAEEFGNLTPEQLAAPIPTVEVRTAGGERKGPGASAGGVAPRALVAERRVRQLCACSGCRSGSLPVRAAACTWRGPSPSSAQPAVCGRRSPARSPLRAGGPFRVRVCRGGIGPRAYRGARSASARD